MIVEYKGVADRWAGPGGVHEVRAWWNVYENTEGQVKRAAVDTLTPANGVVVTGTAEVIGMDTDTYSTPQLNAMVRIRVLTAAELATRTELRARVYRRCDGCGNDQPGYLVRRLTGADTDVRVEQSHELEGGGTVHRVTFGKVPSDAELALCYSCWHPIKADCKVLHWIKADGKLQV